MSYWIYSGLGAFKLKQLFLRITFCSYCRFLLLIAGIGGLLLGVDLGIIAAALLYLGKTIDLTVNQTSLIVSSVLGGGMISSLAAGILADWLGRKTMMLVSGFLFIFSVVAIIFSHGFSSLFLGRLLQGISGGVIAIVVPLYLAECLSASKRGSGSAIFQLMLTLGIAIAAVAGWFYSKRAEHAILAAAGNAMLIRAAQDHAWRMMFLFVIYPSTLFVLGSIFLSESPRWLFRQGRMLESLQALRRSSSEEEAQRQLQEMQARQTEEIGRESQEDSGSLLQRRYVVPFLLVCVILTCTQATGINSILGYLVVILKQAGMSAIHATQGDILIKTLSFVFTLVAVYLVDTKGRRFLLTLGTTGIIVSLSAGALLFYRTEAKQIDVKDVIEREIHENGIHFPISNLSSNHKSKEITCLTVRYSYGTGDRIEIVRSDEYGGTLNIQPEDRKASAPLIVKSASYGLVPTETTGWIIAACLGVFIATYSVGPGVAVWLVLSELMPTRIRAAGMGIAVLLNQGTSTLIAGMFLPVVGVHGYSAMFAFWAACTVIYLLTTIFFLPETKGKTLEEIERLFEARTFTNA